MKKFFGGLEKYELSETAWDEIIRLAKIKYQSWAWNYGKTPEFSIRHRMKSERRNSSIRIHVERGYIRKIDFEGDDPGTGTTAYLEKQLIGEPYDLNNLAVKDQLSSLTEFSEITASI